ncbi:MULTISPECIES: hypothetical protein [unclassified Streptomyces]|uniref:hypothetical protein n=1 Tax=unclassified Streptomyces TaxID=2593676 RepID=UPI0033CFBCF4
MNRHPHTPTAPRKHPVPALAVRERLTAADNACAADLSDGTIDGLALLQQLRDHPDLAVLDADLDHIRHRS